MHQLFVTANPILRTSVAKSFKALQSGFVASMASAVPFDGTTPAAPTAPPVAAAAEEEEDIVALEDVHESSWPLFLRAHHWLRLLDGTLAEGHRFFTDEERAAAAAAAAGWHTEKGGLEELPTLLDEDEEDEGEEEEEEGVGAEGGKEGDASHGAAGGQASIRPEVNFDGFERALWPLMIGKGMPGADDARGALADVQTSKDLLDKVRKAPVKASLVFREIVSYIKGSSQALSSPNGRLSRASYLSIGRKMAPSFDKVEEGGGTAASGVVGRDLVYDLYLKYEAWKEAFGAYDVMDACAAIHSALRKHGYHGPRIDEIYVDEVQDFTQAELLLFLQVCSDKNALFFTGDTCQTIARGVGFRFEDLTTMFYQLGEQRKADLLSRGQRLEDVPKCELVQVPKVNKLSINYRTHNGILGAASEIVTLLLELFPHSVDALEKDVGHFDGPLPTLLTDTSKDDLSILLCGSDPQHSQIEFGAHQVVLVRDQAAKDRLPAELQSALTLTIFEAKGLEFDDVFLFNFFADSPADERTWRVLTSVRSNGSKEGSGGQAGHETGSSHRTAPHKKADPNAADAATDADAELTIQAPRPEPFDRQKHSLLNEELKMLYTAITRARVKVPPYPHPSPSSFTLTLAHTHTLPPYPPPSPATLCSPSTATLHPETLHPHPHPKVVVYDEDEEKRRPVFHYLLTSRLAKVFDSREANRGLAASSTPEEWVRQAKNLMRQQLFQIAALCYQKGNDQRGMLEALAMHFFQPSAAATDARPADRLLRAARCFELAGHTLHAANCLRRAGEVTLAASAYAKLGKHVPMAKMLATAAEKTNSRREAVELLAASAKAWEDAGRLTQAMLVRLSHKELQPSGLEMLNQSFPERDRLRQVALPHLEARKLYDAALAVCQQLGLDHKVEELARTSAFHHLRRGDKASMFSAVKQFSSPAMQIAFLRQHGERSQVVELMQAQGLVEEAHDEMLIGGDYRLAALSTYSASGDEGGEQPAVAWLSRTFQLSSALRTKASQAATDDLGSFLLQVEEQHRRNPPAMRWTDLTIFTVLDAYQEGCARFTLHTHSTPHTPHFTLCTSLHRSQESCARGPSEEPSCQQLAWVSQVSAKCGSVKGAASSVLCAG